MSKTHELKIWPSHFEKVRNGSKPFEVRKNDRDFAVGDVLDLREWDPTPAGGFGLNVGTPTGYTDRWVERVVTCVLTGTEWGIAEGYCVMGLAE